jgi:hypothetical protein
LRGIVLFWFMGGVGVGLRDDWTEVNEAADSAAPLDKGVFRAAITRASSLLGSLASSSLASGPGFGGGGDLDRDGFLSLRLNLPALLLAIPEVDAAAAILGAVVTYKNWARLQMSDWLDKDIALCAMVAESGCTKSFVAKLESSHRPNPQMDR